MTLKTWLKWFGFGTRPRKQATSTEESLDCKVNKCKNIKSMGDSLFCYEHREEWRVACTHLNSRYSEEEKQLWIRRFCE